MPILGRLWCSTKTSRNGQHLKGNWGYCDCQGTYNTCLCISWSNLIQTFSLGSNPKVDVCEHPYGYYENVGDVTCGSFIQCSKGTPFVINCPRRSQVYDPVRKICVRSFEYECPRGGSGKTTKRPTTVRPSTTTARPLSTTTRANESQPMKQKIVCYYPNWAYYRKGIFLSAL